MNKIVISLGGSIISTPVPNQSKSVYAAWLQQLSQQALVCVIVGGGYRARASMDQAKQDDPKITNDALDWIGIQASQANAKILMEACGLTGEIITDPHKVVPERAGIVFGGGWKPGRSTDYCAIQLAISNQVNTITNISNIDGVYSKDPKQYPDAEKKSELNWLELQTIVGDTWTPGLNMPFDPIAAKLASEHHITVNIVNGKDLNNVNQAVQGKNFRGTVIHP